MLESLHAFLQKRPASVGGAYSVARSLRFNSADSAYLSRTPSAGNRKTWTFSCWFKRASLGAAQTIFGIYNGSADATAGAINFNASDQLRVVAWGTTWRISNQVFRDPAAWYHLVVAMDTTQATAANRLKVYINGSEITSWATNNAPTQNTDYAINQAAAHQIGDWAPNGTTGAGYFGGYLAEVHFVDGAALDPTSFGQTDATTGQWVPKQVTGVTYGTNGFWLSFYDNTSTTTLGRDDAGGAAGSAAGSNDWALSNFSVTAGVGNDSLTDTPTQNTCTLSPLAKGSSITLANGNLDWSVSSLTGTFGCDASFAMDASLDWYWEITANTLSTTAGNFFPGIVSMGTAPGGVTGTGFYCYIEDGTKHVSGSTSSFGATYTAADVISFRLNAGTLTAYKNGSSQGNIATGLTGYFVPIMGFSAGTSRTASFSFNFGQRPYVYSITNKPLNVAGLSTPSIVKPNAQFDVEAFMGTGATRSKTGLGFQPDLVWFKGRSGATDHALYDSTRGVQKQIESNTTTAETTETTGLTAFNSDGYTTGALAQLNTNAATYAAWLWKKGVTPGFDIVSYTGNGSNRTISHALGVAPKFMIVKNLSATSNWRAWHNSISVANTLYINLTNASTSDANAWNSTGPTSSVFSVGTAAETNGSGNSLVAYLFAEVAGFSRFGSYTGNGSADGPFVHCGFRPRFVMVKRTDSASDWFIYDTARNTANVADLKLYSNQAVVENGSAGETSSTNNIDILSNGFKLRTTNGSNTSGGTYIFAAFAEFPFKYANAR